MAIFADDFNAAVFGGNGDLAIDERQGGAAKFADLFFAAEEVAGVGVAFVSAAERGGEGLGVERDGGQECQVQEWGEAAHGSLLRIGGTDWYGRG